MIGAGRSAARPLPLKLIRAANRAATFAGSAVSTTTVSLPLEFVPGFFFSRKLAGRQNAVARTFAHDVGGRRDNTMHLNALATYALRDTFNPTYFSFPLAESSR